MAIGADIAVDKARRRSKERLRKCQRRARKQLCKWTHIVGAVRSESAYVDLDFGTTSSQNGTALQVGCPAPPDMQRKIEIVLFLRKCSD